MRIPVVIDSRIVAGRPYSSVENLGRVAGIGPKWLEKIRPLAAVE
jgi:DNA uptake protein ComE-like DNA-binding protein